MSFDIAAWSASAALWSKKNRRVFQPQILQTYDCNAVLSWPNNNNQNITTTPPPKKKETTEISHLWKKENHFGKSVFGKRWLRSFQKGNETLNQSSHFHDDDASWEEFTLPETNILHLKMMVSNRNLPFQGSIFRCELLVSGRVPVFNLVFKNAEKSIKCCSTTFSYRVERCDSLGTEFWTRTPFFSGFATQHQYQYIPETPNNQF